MSPIGVVCMTWLALVLRLPLRFAHPTEPEGAPATERNASPTFGGGQVSQFPSSRISGLRADKERIKREVELADRDARQHVFGERAGGQLNLLLAAIRDEAERPQCKRSRNASVNGAVSRTLERAHRRTRRKAWGEAIQFKYLARTGAWCVSDPLVAQVYRWINLAQAANLSLGFRVRDFRIKGKRVRDLLTFGMHSDRANYAVPCTDVRWDGQSWRGPMTWDARRGSGCAVMKAFLGAIEQSLTEMKADGGYLQCVLTADDAENPQELVWQIVRSGGEVAIRMKFERAPTSRDELLGRPPRSSGEVAGFKRFAKTGAWRASDPLAPHDHRWIYLAHDANMSLGFRTRDVNFNGKRARRVFTFGMQLDSANYALPCAHLRWDGQSWRGPITPDARRGSGGVVMDTLLRAIEEILFDIKADGGYLQCVLTADDAEHPQEMVWQMVGSRAMPVMSMLLQRVAP